VVDAGKPHEVRVYLENLFFRDFAGAFADHALHQPENRYEVVAENGTHEDLNPRVRGGHARAEPVRRFLQRCGAEHFAGSPMGFSVRIAARS
jgi:hypothetical protein